MQVVLTNGSYATETRESRQVRKEAAVSGAFRVPWGCLFRANYMSTLGWYLSKIGAQHYLL
jgi:hypothetical protein